MQGKVHDMMPKLSSIDWDIVIFADTVCDLDGKIIEKPRSAEEVTEMLRDFSGKWH
jgi:predicted house-cleaning NTP pyrophosphatase (Maf/HAM1 superfamily)